MDRGTCLAADRDDPLAPLRDRFRIPDAMVYLDSNSLGPLQPEVARRVESGAWDRSEYRGRRAVT